MQINGREIELPKNVNTFTTNGGYTYLVYRDWEIETVDAGGPWKTDMFSVIDGNDWVMFDTLEQAMKWIDKQIEG